MTRPVSYDLTPRTTMSATSAPVSSTSTTASDVAGRCVQSSRSSGTSGTGPGALTAQAGDVPATCSPRRAFGAEMTAWPGHNAG
jgi:hypothetical protein